MAGARVLVHDVDSLELFMETLQAKRDDAGSIIRYSWKRNCE